MTCWWIFIWVAAGLAPLVAAPEPKPARAVPAEVRALAGTYAGAWTTYGLAPGGSVVARMSWKDVMRAEEPALDGDVAYVRTTDDMTFEGEVRPPLRVNGREGYVLRPDGTPGEYFVETFGERHTLNRLAPDTWAYSTTADPRELAGLGFPAGAAGRHVVVKVVTREGGVETHRISRVTTVHWKDADKKERTLQFVSLQGYHRRVS